MCIPLVLLVFGIYALVAGKLPITRKRVVRGVPARLIGLIGVLQLPLNSAFGFIYGHQMAARGEQLTIGDFNDPNYRTLTIIGAVITFGSLILMIVLGLVLARPVERKGLRPRQKYQDDGDGPPLREDRDR